MSLLEEAYRKYTQVEIPVTEPGDSRPKHSDLSEARVLEPIVQSVDQWSKRLQKSPEKLRQAAGDDWEEMSADIIGFADALAVNQIRESGAIPSSYTSETFCRKCNSYVPFYEGVPEIGSCSWCRNDQSPPPVPELSYSNDSWDKVTK